jgi:hypothetical protein
MQYSVNESTECDELWLVAAEECIMIAGSPGPAG